jgi:hypothetical protein
MVWGHPHKHQRNISGLQNQAVPIQSEPDTDLEEDLYLAVTFDSLKPDLEKEDMMWESDSEDSDMGEQSEWEELDNKDLHETMAKMAMKEKQVDGDWIPRTLRKKQNIKKGVDAHTGTCANLPITQILVPIAWPQEYQKGPDVMSKSKCTQERYAKQWKSQTKLDAFGFFQQMTSPLTPLGPITVDSDAPPMLSDEPAPSPKVIPHTWSISALSVSSEPESGSNSKSDGHHDELESEVTHQQDHIDINNNLEDLDDLADSEAEAWEDKLMEAVQSKDECHNWSVLHDHIKGILKTKSQTLSYP